jgi:hypothetical protein
MLRICNVNKNSLIASPKKKLNKIKQNISLNMSYHLVQMREDKKIKNKFIIILIHLIILLEH